MEELQKVNLYEIKTSVTTKIGSNLDPKQEKALIKNETSNEITYLLSPQICPTSTLKCSL